MFLTVTLNIRADLHLHGRYRTIIFLLFFSAETTPKGLQSTENLSHSKENLMDFKDKPRGPSLAADSKVKLGRDGLLKV